MFLPKSHFPYNNLKIKFFLNLGIITENQLTQEKLGKTIQNPNITNLGNRIIQIESINSLRVNSQLNRTKIMNKHVVTIQSHHTQQILIGTLGDLFQIPYQDLRANTQNNNPIEFDNMQENIVAHSSHK